MVKEEKIRKILGYARVSRDKQDVNNQISALKTLGILDEDIYDDTNVSGTIAPIKRKGFKQVYDRIKNGEVETLYVFELSRLGRTSSESIKMFIEIEEMGCHIKSLSDMEKWTVFSDDQATRNMFTGFAAWFSDMERRHISERTKLSVQSRREKGEHIGRDFKEPDEKKYRKYKEQNMRDATIARTMQVPTATLYRWIKRWDERDRIARNKAIE